MSLYAFSIARPVLLACALLEFAVALGLLLRVVDLLVLVNLSQHPLILHRTASA